MRKNYTQEKIQEQEKEEKIHNNNIFHPQLTTVNNRSHFIQSIQNVSGTTVLRIPSLPIENIGPKTQEPKNCSLQ